MYGIGAGSFAEYAVAKEAKLARKPANLTFEQAAVVPVSGLTALQAVRDVGRVQSGQRVLVTGASGGVGSYAVQVAKAFGAEVTGVCSTSKLDLVRSLGADHVIDYTQEHFADRAEQWDVIIDINGSTGVRRLARGPDPARHRRPRRRRERRHVDGRLPRPTDPRHGAVARSPASGWPWSWPRRPASTSTS